MKRFFKLICIVVLCLALCSCLSSGQTASKSTSTKKYNYSYEDIQPPKIEIITFEIETFDFEKWEGENTYMITYSARLSYNNHVGDSWGYGLEYNGDYVSSGSYVTCMKIAKGIAVTVYAVEYDNVSDYGSAYVTFDSIDVGKKKTKEVTVTVRENRGRYAGNTAQWIFEITVERIS